MRYLRKVIRKMILEAFSERDVRAEMLATQRSYGATAKELFRRQAEEAPEIREFLNTLFYMHWSDVPVDADGTIGDPMANKRSNDELSCNAYGKYDDGSPMWGGQGWGAGVKDRLGFEVEGWVTFLEHGDSQSGRTGKGTMPDGSKNNMSGDNKQPRKHMMGRDPRKRDSMADVIQSYKDFTKRMHKRVSTRGYGHNEALVDNWELKCIWFKDEDSQTLAEEVSDLLSEKYGRTIPIRSL